MLKQCVKLQAAGRCSLTRYCWRVGCWFLSIYKTITLHVYLNKHSCSRNSSPLCSGAAGRTVDSAFRTALASIHCFHYDDLDAIAWVTQCHIPDFYSLVNCNFLYIWGNIPRSAYFYCVTWFHSFSIGFNFMIECKKQRSIKIRHFQEKFVLANTGRSYLPARHQWKITTGGGGKKII